MTMGVKLRSWMGVGTRFIASQEVGSHVAPPPRPVGRDKSGPYDLLATLVSLRLMPIMADKSAVGTINRNTVQIRRGGLQMVYNEVWKKQLIPRRRLLMPYRIRQIAPESKC